MSCICTLHALSSAIVITHHLAIAEPMPIQSRLLRLFTIKWLFCNKATAYLFVVGCCSQLPCRRSSVGAVPHWMQNGKTNNTPQTVSFPWRSGVVVTTDVALNRKSTEEKQNRYFKISALSKTTTTGWPTGEASYWSRGLCSSSFAG